MPLSQVIETIPRPFIKRDPNELTVPLFVDAVVKDRNRKKICNQRYDFAVSSLCLSVP